MVDSQAAVDRNAVVVTANANVATANSVQVSGNDVAATAALANLQRADGSVSALALSTSATAEIDGNVLSSAVSVDSNGGATLASANTATNRVSVTANTLRQGSLETDVGSSGLDLAAAANIALANEQVVGSTSVASLAVSLFEIRLAAGEPTATADSSDLSVSGNSQAATATGNAATNLVAMLAVSESGDATGGSGTNAASQSRQVSAASLLALSSAAFDAPVIVSDSSVEISRNSNAASATGNSTSNLVSASAETILVSSSGSDAQIDVAADREAFSGSADLVLANLQSQGTTSITAVANTTLTNSDAHQAGTISQSSIAMKDNATHGHASANRASNTLTLSSGGQATTSGGVMNVQATASDTTAYANTNMLVNIGDAGNGAGMLDASTVSLARNSTVSQSVGNSASNSVTADALALNSQGSRAVNASLGGSASGDSASASIAILNDQSNRGSIAAATNPQYALAAQGDVAVPGATVRSSSTEITANLATASGVGNAAVNRIALNAAQYGPATDATVASDQLNTGSIEVGVVAASYGISISGGTQPSVSGSSLSIGGSALASIGTGNSVVASITRN